MSIESGVIQALRLERIETVTKAMDRYEFRVDRPAHWLQRLCFWVLGKLGAYADFHTVTIERHVIGKHGDTFAKRLFEQTDSLMNEFNRRPTQLLIGSEDYAGLMQEPLSHQMFDFDSRYFMGNGAREPTVHGLKVRVIPWMRGMLVLP